MILLKIPGKPVAQGRPLASIKWKRDRDVRAEPRVHMRDPEPARRYKAHVKRCARKIIKEVGSPPPLEGPVRVAITFWFPLPKRDHRKRQPAGERRHTGKPDLDNLAKCVLDGCNGLIWKDDAQVCALSVEKYYAHQEEEPGAILIANPIVDAVDTPNDGFPEGRCAGCRSTWNVGADGLCRECHEDLAEELPR